jgi:hypothetical protein
MSNTPSIPSRRQFFRTAAVAAVGAPIAFKLLTQPAMAASTKPPLPVDNPQAVALGYIEDAAKVDKTKHANFKEGSNCNNCQFHQGAEGDWVDCMLFPNNSVAGPGWCISWAPKPA